MKVKLLTRMAGPTGNYEVGSILDIEKGEALQLICGRYAQDLEPQKEEVKITIKKKG